MEKTYRVQESLNRERTLTLPHPLCARAGLSGEARLAFGARDLPVRIGPGEGPEIGLSPDLMRHFGIPADAFFRARVGLHDVRLGPVVGVLAAATPEELDEGRLRAISNHFLAEAERGGLFLAFDRESMDIANRLVKGWRFLVGDGPTWKQGVFPLPQTVIRRYGVTLGPALEALQSFGVKVVNQRVFNKGEAYAWMNSVPSLKPYLPETVPLRGTPTVLSLLSKYESVYVKPVWGSLAAGVTRVSHLDAGYAVTSTGKPTVDCGDEAALTGVLTGLLPDAGIVQQGLELARVGERLLDFRVVLQKDGRGQWRVPGIVGRLGESGFHVSNMATGGFPVPVETAIGFLFGSNPVTVLQRKQEVIRIALLVGEGIDRSGLLIGDLGLDIAYDWHGQPWVIEANNRDPDHNIAWESGDWPLFYDFRNLPVQHAIYLAGFDPDN